MADDDIHDLAILGAGSGGLAAARRAREAGLSVVLFEGQAAGGTCVNRGGVPKKLLVHASRQGDALRASADLGWSTGDIAFDWATLRDKVGAEVRELSRTERATLVERGVTYVDARARLLAADRVGTEDGREFRARNIIVATGARPLVPDLPGHEHALVSDDVFTLDALPRRVAMVGGGYIAVELASLLRRFGVEVEIFESSARILDGFEPEIVERLQARMEGDGIAIHPDTTIARIEKATDEEGGYAVVLEGGARHDGFDAVMLLIGRAPNTDDIGLEEIGVTLDDHGQIPVDAHGRTNVAGVFAVGDVAHALQLVPVAIRSACNTIDGILGRTFEPLLETRVPAGVYATPELGSVGLDEAMAEERGFAVEVRRADFSPLADRLATSPSDDMLVKLVVERATGTVLGMHVCGENAAEIVQMGTLLIEAGANVHHFERAVSLHPTNAEEIVELGEARYPLEPLADD